MTTTNNAADLISSHCSTITLDDGRLAYRAAESGDWWALSADDLDALGRMMADGRRDAYSRWCAAGYGERVEIDD